MHHPKMRYVSEDGQVDRQMFQNAFHSRQYLPLSSCRRMEVERQQQELLAVHGHKLLQHCCDADEWEMILMLVDGRTGCILQGKVVVVRNRVD